MFKIEYEFGDWEKFFVDNEMSFQWVVGLYFPIGNRILVDVEYKNLIGTNHLVRELHQYDVAGNYFERFDAFAQSFSLGINWKIK